MGPDPSMLSEFAGPLQPSDGLAFGYVRDLRDLGIRQGSPY